MTDDAEQADKEKERNELKAYYQKDVAYYETFLSAWIENRMEKDKQILTLSALSLGLLTTLYDKISSVSQFWIWIISAGLFILACTFILLIFKWNSDYISEIINDNDNPRKQRLNKSLDIMTVIAFLFFLAGVILTFVLFIMKSDFMLVKVTGGS